MAGGGLHTAHLGGLSGARAEGILRQFPFRIKGFHTDNGSEFINSTVAELLNKLLIEQTKSRPLQSGDNGLVETKNGAVIPKHIGYGYIDAAHADTINSFYREYLNRYLNYHRPSTQPDFEIDEKGRKRGRFRQGAQQVAVFGNRKNRFPHSLRPGCDC